MFKISYENVLIPFRLLILIGLQLLLINKVAFSQSQEVHGVVTDSESGESLPGVNVIIKGTSQGTATNSDGTYSINVPSLSDTLIFSFLGYQKTEVAIEGRTEINVELNSEVIQGSDVIVVGYGVQTTRNISSSVQNVGSDELEDAPVGQLGQKLQGKLSGVNIKQTSGRPGEGLKVQIRGSASITTGSDPLYIIDGMPIEGDISNINPSEIESISVLKDAAATSLYGSRAANGVVLVQTKTAKPGQTQVELNSYYGFEYIPQNWRLDMMNAREYAQFQKEIDEFNGRPVDPQFQNPNQYDEGTDWYDVVMKDAAPIQSYDLTMSTGTEKFNTSAMAGFFNQDGVVKETGYQRFSLRINSRYKPTDKMNIGFNIAPTFITDTNFPTDGWPYVTENVISSALITTPLASPYNPDGSLALTATDAATFPNPNWLRVIKDKKYEEEKRGLLSNLFLEYELIDGLTIKTAANINLGTRRLTQFNPSTIGVLFVPPPQIPSGSEDSNSFYNWSNENTVQYKTQIGDHNIDGLVGFTAQKYRNEGNLITGTNFPDDKVTSMNAAGQISVNSDIQEWTLLSLLARLTYSYKDKYLLTASIRRDGSSRFGPNNRWGNFPSASIGWIISEENFWNFKPISFLKVRASYGIVGNFNIGNYSYIPTLDAANYAFGNSAYSGRAVENIGDKNLGWERNEEYNLGADIYLLNDRIQLTYNYYNKKTSNLLFNVEIPSSSGFDNIQTNIGELKFWGHEIMIKSRNISSDNLFWNTSFNISFDRNRTVSLATKGESLGQGLQLYGFYSHRTDVGKPIGMFYGAIHQGVYVDQEDFDNSPKHASSQVGTVKFKDVNGDGVITFPADMTYIGNPWPDFTFGMTNQVNYNDFDLSVSIAGSYGNDILAFHENWTANLDGVFNVLAEVKDRWKSPDDPGDGKYGSVQQGTTFLERDRYNSRYIKDGSYLAVKNITLGYTLPLSKDKFVQKLRVYGSIQNAFRFTGYPGPNPEVNTRSTGSGSTPGFDENSYPVPRTITLGVNLQF